jgi:(p)ppGpp synthase/HD superfamily hydrolase
MLSATLEDEINAVRGNLGNLYRNNPIVLGDFDRLFDQWWQEFQKTDGAFPLQNLVAAVDFAGIKHVSQVRSHADWVPYIIHPLRVALLLWEEGDIREADQIVAALLHHTLKDTKTLPEEIEIFFGLAVLKLIQQLPECLDMCRDEKISPDAKAIKLADCTHNLRDLLDHPPKIWKSDKIASFIEKSQELLRALQGVNVKLERAYITALDKLIQINRS